MSVPRETWWLPRPKRNKYKGGYPLWFEEKLLTQYGFDYKNEDLKDKVLHIFAGMTKFGFRVDIKPEVEPDLICDAHNLPDDWTDKWEMVILDPPYSDEESKELYGTGKLSYKKYISEAVRVCKPDGCVAMYHKVLTPRPEGTHRDRIIVVLTRVWHKPRVCTIFQKKSYDSSKQKETDHLYGGTQDGEQ